MIQPFFVAIYICQLYDAIDAFANDVLSFLNGNTCLRPILLNITVKLLLLHIISVVFNK